MYGCSAWQTSFSLFSLLIKNEEKRKQEFCKLHVEKAQVT